MADFVESATLKVNDQSTKNLRAINQEIVKLISNAQKAQRVLGSVKTPTFKTNNITQINNSLKNLAKTAQGVNKNLTINPRVNTTGLNNANRALNSMQQRAQRVANTVNSIGSGINNTRGAANGGAGNGGRPPRLPPPGGHGPGGGGVVTLAFESFRQFADGFIERLRRGIEEGIISGFKEGGKETDVAQTRLRALNFSPSERAQINTLATQTANDPRFQQFNRTQVVSTMSEVAPAVGNNIPNTQKVTQMLLTYANALIAGGMSSEKATENLLQVTKSLGMSGVLLDSKGNFQEEAAKAVMKVITQETITGGAEMTPGLIQQLFKYSATTGQNLNPEGLRTLLFLGEDYGSRAAVGLNQMERQLQGRHVPKDVISNLMDFGLITSREVKEGTTNGKTRTTTVVDQVKDLDRMRNDPLSYIRETLIPALVKKGIDPTNNNEVQSAVEKITSTQTAGPILTTLITNMAEAMQRQKLALDRPDPEKALPGILDQSLFAGLDQAATQFKGLLGEVSNAFKDELLPPIHTISNLLREATNFIAGGDGNSGTGTGGAVRAGIVGGTAVGGAFALRGAWGLLTNPFGLSTAGSMLQAAATQLMNAAAQLGGAPGGGGTNGPGGRSSPAISWQQMALGITLAINAGLHSADIVDEKGNLKPVQWVTDFNNSFKNLTPSAIIDAIFGSSKTAAPPTSPYAGNDAFQATQNQMLADRNGTTDPVAQAIQTTANSATNTVTDAFSSGAQAANGTIQTGAATAGQSIADTFLGFATGWGETAGAAFRAAVGEITAQVSTAPATAAPDTGANTNGAR